MDQPAAQKQVQPPPPAAKRPPPLLSNYVKFLVIFHCSMMLHATKRRHQRDGQSVSFVNRNIPVERLKYRSLGLFCVLLSTCSYIIFTIVCFCFEDQILDTSDEYNALKCFWPKPSMTRYINNKNTLNLVMLFGATHLVWRYWIIFHKRDFSIDVISFLINERGEFIDDDDDQSHSNSPTATAFKDNSQQQQQQQRNDSLNMNIESEATVDLMFQRIVDPQTSKERLILRPNRTQQARANLIRYLNETFAFSMGLFLVMFSFIAFMGFYTILGEQRSLFPGCDQNILSWSYAIRTSSSLMMGGILLVDTIAAIHFAVSMLKMIVFDVNTYWSHISKQLASLKADSIVWRLSSGREHHQHHHGHHDPAMDHLGHHHAIFSSNLLNLDPLALSVNIDWRRKCDRMDEGMAKLRDSFVDFCELIKRSDAYASILIPASLGLWLTANALISICGLQFENSKNSVAIRALQLAIFGIVNQVSTVVLNFKQRTESAYGEMCSLIALDPGSNKRVWLGAMSYYTENPQYAFTFAGRKIYSRLTYLTFISYSFTFTFLYENFKLIQSQPENSAYATSNHHHHYQAASINDSSYVIY